MLDGVVTLRPSRNFIDQTRILLDGHVLGKTGSVENMRTLGDIVTILKVFQCGFSELETLLEATEGQPSMRLVKSVGPCQESTGRKRPSILIIPPVENGGFG